MRAMSIYEHDNLQKSDEVKNAQNILAKALEYFFKKGYCSPDVPQSFRLLRRAELEKEKKMFFQTDFTKCSGAHKERNIRFFETLETEGRVIYKQAVGYRKPGQDPEEIGPYDNYHDLLVVDGNVIPVPVFTQIVGWGDVEEDSDDSGLTSSFIIINRLRKLGITVERAERTMIELWRGDRQQGAWCWTEYSQVNEQYGVVREGDDYCLIDLIRSKRVVEFSGDEVSFLENVQEKPLPTRTIYLKEDPEEKKYNFMGYSEKINLRESLETRAGWRGTIADRNEGDFFSFIPEGEFQFPAEVYEVSVVDPPQKAYYFTASPKALANILENHSVFATLFTARGLALGNILWAVRRLQNIGRIDSDMWERIFEALGPRNFLGREDIFSQFRSYLDAGYVYKNKVRFVRASYGLSYDIFGNFLPDEVRGVLGGYNDRVDDYAKNCVFNLSFVSLMRGKPASNLVEVASSAMEVLSELERMLSDKKP